MEGSDYMRYTQIEYVADRLKTFLHEEEGELSLIRLLLFLIQ